MNTIVSIEEFCKKHGTTVDALKNGGSLDLEGTQIASLPDNLTVGGFLDLEGTQIADEEAGKVNKLHTETVLTWKNGKYILADEIFSEVILQRGNVRKIKNIGKTTIGYLITDGKGKWAHGNTLKEAKEGLIYKIGDRDTSKYKQLTVDSILSFNEAVEAYRVITGACAAGTRMFVEGLERVKKEYSIREIIELTKGQYNSTTFAHFFSY